MTCFRPVTLSLVLTTYLEVGFCRSSPSICNINREGGSRRRLSCCLKLLSCSCFVAMQEGDQDYMSELQQLQQEGEMPIDDLLASLPPEMLEMERPLTPESEEKEEEQDKEEGGDEKGRKKKEAEESQLNVRALRKRTQQQRLREDAALTQSGSEAGGQQRSRKRLVGNHWLTVYMYTMYNVQGHCFVYSGARKKLKVVVILSMRLCMKKKRERRRSPP